LRKWGSGGREEGGRGRRWYRIVVVLPCIVCGIYILMQRLSFVVVNLDYFGPPGAEIELSNSSFRIRATLTAVVTTNKQNTFCSCVSSLTDGILNVLVFTKPEPLIFCGTVKLKSLLPPSMQPCLLLLLRHRKAASEDVNFQFFCYALWLCQFLDDCIDLLKCILIDID
jgi:hypothetical protein